MPSFLSGTQYKNVMKLNLYEDNNWWPHSNNEEAYDKIATELKNAQQIPRREWDGEKILYDEENRTIEEQATYMV